MESKTLILGAGGQLGRALVQALENQAIAAQHSDIDLNKSDIGAQIDAFVGKASITAIINAAAYTAVDKAEGEGREAAMRVNGSAVGELAAWCAQHDVPLIHFSTDYVFDGSGGAPRNENAPVNPINAYGESKLSGERALAASGAKYLLFRTSWVYDAAGKNFYHTIVRLLREKKSLKVVADQLGAPTYAPHLANSALAGLAAASAKQEFPSGLYHLCAGGETSWHGFAQAIFTLARTRDSSIKCQHIDPIPTTEYPLPAKRPLNSRLDCSKAKNTLGIFLPDWEAGLKECIEETYGRQGLHGNGLKNHPAETAGG